MKRMQTSKEFHEAAMTLYEDSIVARYKKDEPERQRLLAQALPLEKQAAMLLKDRLDLEPTRSNLFASAAVMARQMGLIGEMRELINISLAGSPKPYLRDELLQILEDCEFFDNDGASLKTPKQLHQEAMDLSQKAIMMRCGYIEANAEIIYDFVRRAYKLERSAALMLLDKKDCEPTRSLLLMSAGALAMEIELWSEALYLLDLGLGGAPDKDVEKNIIDMIDECIFQLSL